MNKIKGYQYFKGWHWTELIDHWGVFGDNNKLTMALKEKKMTQYLEMLLSKRFYNGRVMKKAAADIRAYCKAMTQYPVGPIVIWKALNNETSDFEVINVFMHLFPIAWT